MKSIAILAAAVVLLAVAVADEDRRTRIMNFYECISCADHPAVQEEYLKCAEIKPEKCKKAVQNCKNKLMINTTTPKEFFDTLCTTKDLIGQIHDCIMEDENRKNMDDDEKKAFKTYMQCTKKVNKKFCLKDRNE